MRSEEYKLRKEKLAFAMDILRRHGFTEEYPRYYIGGEYHIDEVDRNNEMLFEKFRKEFTERYGPDEAWKYFGKAKAWLLGEIVKAKRNK